MPSLALEYKRMDINSLTYNFFQERYAADRDAIVTRNIERKICEHMPDDPDVTECHVCDFKQE